MRASGEQMVLTATDLANFLSCRHRTGLEMAEANGKHQRPRWHDPLLKILFQRGLEHEKAYVESLQAGGRQVVSLADVGDPLAAEAQTLAAMRSGADIIVQAALSDGRWSGRPDVLRRTPEESDLGAWAYEVVDTKLARETRSGTILQLGLYSEMLGVAQGRRPEYFYVVTPALEAPVHEYRTDDYAAYFRLVRTQIARMVDLDDDVVLAANYPEPVDHCDVCPWSSGCSKKRRQDDHLSLVAGISRLQRRELESRSVSTLERLAQLPVPLAFKPRRGAVDTYVRVREQARVQFESRGRATPIHELRPLEAGKGLGRLPEPSAGDVFLDLEGDLFAAEGGREYLFGVVTIDPSGAPQYRSLWAFTEQQERQAFESVMDLVMESWKAHEGMHLYHYAPYEASAFKRLMGRYATRQQELDRLLRAGRFVDLYGVVRQGLRAGIERYSIKNLEILYGFNRAVPLPDASRSLLVMEQALELKCPETVAKEVRDLVQGYNEDDCQSAHRLRNWLEQLRSEVESTGAVVPRPTSEQGDPSAKVEESVQRVAALRARLLSGVPEAAVDRTEEQHARWLLAYLLDFHRRENNAGSWEYYRLRELPEEDLFDEPQALAGLEYVERVTVVLHKTSGKPTGSVIDRYRFPAQEMEIRRGHELKVQDGQKVGEVIEIDRTALTIDVKQGPSQKDNHPTAVFTSKYVKTDVLEDALCAIGEDVVASGSMSLAEGQPDPIARGLLLARPPRLRSGTLSPVSSESSVDVAVRVASDLDETVLAIQGPPGCGKTFSGGEMICALIQQGRTVGVTATGHKVIRNLLDAVNKAAKKKGMSVRLAHKTDDDDEGGSEGSWVTLVRDNEDALDALQSRSADVLGGTAWLWARPEFARAVDVLFVDEAGQMSLANVVAVSRAAKSIVLLGDPQQLEQPRKGSHPEGVATSALQHILGTHKTIPSDRGIFLGVTWRLAPRLCSFTSELFYEGRLTSKPGLVHQRLVGVGDFDGSGLRIIEADHSGNRNSSMEEVEIVADLVARLMAPGARWIDENGEGKQIPEVEQRVNVAPQEEAVPQIMLPAVRVRLDVRGLEHRQRLLPRDRAPALVHVGDENAERALAQARVGDRWCAEAPRGDRRIGKDRRGSAAQRDGRADRSQPLEHEPTFDGAVVVTLALDDVRLPVGRHRDPIALGKEEGLLEQDAADRIVDAGILSRPPVPRETCADLL
jgi:predicted RecB family nuclease